MPHEVQIVRLRLRQYGRYPNDVWAPDVIPVGVVEVEGPTTALDVIWFAKRTFPEIPRHELALVGWPEQREFDLTKLIPLDPPAGEEIQYAYPDKAYVGDRDAA